MKYLALAVLAAAPLLGIGNYPLHLLILVLLWGYIYTSWSLMGRLGLVSFGHGAFMGIGAYVVVMLWNHYGISPWLGSIAAFGAAALTALVIGYPCFRFKIVGHYFALVTLALSEVARLIIVALLGVVLHQLVIRPVLGAEPINQLLVTGGVLFFLQAAATLAFGIEFKNLGVSLPAVPMGEMSFSASRLVAFGVALAGMLVMYFFLKRSYLGTAIRAISQDRAIMPLMGVSPTRIFVTTSALGGGLAGLAACLLVLQYDIHPAIGLSFGPITFLICVLGGLGNMVGGFIAAFLFAQFISVGGFLFALEWGYVIAFVFFIAVMFWRPRGILGSK